jgi:hypothetical protein
MHHIGAAAADQYKCFIFWRSQVWSSQCCNSEYFNGSAWTALGKFKYTRSGIIRSRNRGFTQQHWLLVDKVKHLDLAFVQNLYNGSSWTEITDINTAEIN